MRRSAVLNGRLNQRDRAKMRGKLDSRAHPATARPEEQFAAWLDSFVSCETIEEIESLNLKQFIRESGRFSLAPEERLRQLAVYLEPSLFTPQPRAWLALDRIYDQALRLAPKSIWTLHSRALTAIACADDLKNPNDSTRRRMLQSAWEAATLAQRIQPQEPDVLYLLGSICYFDIDRSVDEALGFFDSAINADQGHQWSLLYRAHCLHDKGQWSAATVSYDKVDAAFFVGPLSWRYELLLEQQAFCQFHSDDRQAAIKLLDKLLDRWIANPKLGFGTIGNYVKSIANELPPHLAEKLATLSGQEDWEWLGMDQASD